VIDILYRKVQNVHAVRASKVELWRLKHENVQKALEEKMEKVNSKDDNWDVIVLKMLKTMKEVCGISSGCSRKETWWWNGDVKKSIEKKDKCRQQKRE